MKKRPTNHDLDKFTTHLIRAYSDSINLEAESPSPYFITRLQARIREKQNVAQIWENGIIKAQSWLVAFSLIALLFFVSNIVLDHIQQTSSQDLAPESLILGDHEWDPIQTSELR